MTDKSKRVAALNDQFRKTGLGGKIVLTQGVRGLPQNVIAYILYKVQHFNELTNEFTQDNDPYGEHDFGVIKIADVGTFYWKIDYYDLDLRYGSEDPSDPTKTTRVLTIMFNHEY